MIFTLSRIVGAGDKGRSVEAGFRVNLALIVDPAAVAQLDQGSSSPSNDGWPETTALRNNNSFEMKSTYIFQPGLATLTEGVRQLHELLAPVVGVKGPANES